MYIFFTFKTNVPVICRIVICQGGNVNEWGYFVGNFQLLIYSVFHNVYVPYVALGPGDSEIES